MGFPEETRRLRSPSLIREVSLHRWLTLPGKAGSGYAVASWRAPAAGSPSGESGRDPEVRAGMAEPLREAEGTQTSLAAPLRPLAKNSAPRKKKKEEEDCAPTWSRRDLWARIGPRGLPFLIKAVRGMWAQE